MHLNLILKSSPSIWIEIDKHLKLGGVEESRVYTIYIHLLPSQVSHVFPGGGGVVIEIPPNPRAIFPEGLGLTMAVSQTGPDRCGDSQGMKGHEGTLETSVWIEFTFDTLVTSVTNRPTITRSLEGTEKVLVRCFLCQGTLYVCSRQDLQRWRVNEDMVIGDCDRTPGNIPTSTWRAPVRSPGDAISK